MLQYRALYPETLELLKDLMKHPQLRDFHLVGGTALALHLGHRISIDIDMFTMKSFNSSKLFEELKSDFKIINKSADVNTLTITIQTKGNKELPVKVDLIRYAYPLLYPIAKSDNIRLLAVEDIIPMKLSALAGRSSKKDFYDIFYLLQKCSLSQMMDYFKQKYHNDNYLHILKSLIYFADADLEPDPITFDNFDWETIKNKITTETNRFLRNA
ncbi:MAG: nucleotidyl transferase AbiEii/AbiGii toxin family protein [Bacteroidota bacterium]